MTTSLAAQADPRTEVRLLRRGRRIKADIKAITWGGAEAILKDFSGKPWPARLLGRLQIEREIRALDRLRGIPGVPACYGRWGRHGVLIEIVRGERISRWCQGRTRGVEAMFLRLDRLVGAMHSRGVVHLDLRKRDNILIDPEGRPSIIDFNASCILPAHGPLGDRMARLLRRIDQSAVGKWKLRLAPDLLAPEEKRRHRRMTSLRRLWIFN